MHILCILFKFSLSNFFFHTVLSHKQLYANILWKRWVYVYTFILRDIWRNRTYAACFSVTPSRGLVVSDFIVNLIFVNILKNEKCATQREKCCRKNLKHKTLKKNFKKISKEMPWTGFEHVPHASS